MDGGKFTGEQTGDIHGRRLCLAEKLLGIMEENGGGIGDGAAFLDNLSRREAVIGELLVLQECLKTPKAAGAPEDAERPEDDAAARTEKVLAMIRELNRKNIDEAGRRLELYRDEMARLKSERRGLAAYLRSSALPGKNHFDLRG